MDRVTNVGADVGPGANNSRDRTLFELLPDPALLIDQESGRVLDANQAAARMLGYARADLIGTSAAEWSAEPDKTAQVLSDGAPHTFFRQQKRKDGTVFPTEVAMSFTELEGRKVAIAAVRDITERKWAEEALHKSEAMLQGITDAMTEPIFLKDREGRCLFANPATLKLLGKAADQVLGKTDLEVHDDPRTAKALVENEQCIMESGVAEIVEETVRTPSGDRILLTSKVPFRDLDGRVLGIVGNARDITERKAIEEALKKSQDALVRAQRVARLGSFEWDIRKNTSEWSDEMFTLLGLRPGAMEPTNEAFFRFIHPEDRDRMEEQLGQDLAARRPHLSVHRLIQEDGTVIWARCQGEFILDAEQNPIRMLGTIQDVTDLKRVEEDLRERNRLKDLFTDIMRHDLMNPAGNVKMAADLLLQIEDDATKTKLLARIRRGATNLIDICESASKYARLADVTQIESGDYELGTILAEVLAGFHAQLQERRINLRFNADRKYPARVNPLIADVFANLVSNAIKYSPEGTTIEVSVRDQGDRWRVLVTDQGPGIPDADKLRVFTRFERLERTGVRGTGLGLAIARHIVELHQGRIWIEDNPGGGSVFCVDIQHGILDAG